MHKQQGFTLIELVVVIIILGILAVTAAPKFIDIQSDARSAAMSGIAGGMRSAADVIYAQAAIDSLLTAGSNGVANNGNATVATPGGDVDIVFGYPRATEDGIIEAAQITNIAPAGNAAANAAQDYVYSVDGRNLYIVPGDMATNANLQNNGFSGCRITYTAPNAANPGVDVDIDTTDC